MKDIDQVLHEQWLKYVDSGGILNLRAYVKVISNYQEYEPYMLTRRELDVILLRSKQNITFESMHLLGYMLDKREDLFKSRRVNGEIKDLTEITSVEIAMDVTKIINSRH